MHQTFEETTGVSADIITAESKSHRPNIYTAIFHQSDLLQVPLARDADATTKDMEGCGPLHLALERRLVANIKARYGVRVDTEAQGAEGAREGERGCPPLPYHEKASCSDIFL